MTTMEIDFKEIVDDAKKEIEKEEMEKKEKEFNAEPKSEPAESRGSRGSAGVESEKNNNENNKEKEKENREKVRAAFLDAKETILEALNDRSMDIYQYCAFLSTNSFYVSPKSGTGFGTVVGEGNNTIRSVTNGLDGDTIRSATTGLGVGDTIRNVTTLSGSGDGDSPYIDDRNSTTIIKKRESINQHTLFSSHRLRKAVPRKYRVMKPMYYWGIIKAILVLGLQLTSVMVSMADLIEQYNEKHDNLCEDQFRFIGVQQSLRKILFAGFSALLAMTVINTMHDLQRSAFYTCLYEYHCLFPDLVDYGWLIAGRSINYLVLILITWASFLIIFCSNDVLDMVINSAAISFVLQLDNMVVGQEQRDVVKHYLDVYEWEIEKRVDAFIHKEEVKRTEWNIVKIFFDFLALFLGTAVVSPAVYITAFLAFVFVPVFMLVCA